MPSQQKKSCLDRVLNIPHLGCEINVESKVHAVQSSL